MIDLDAIKAKLAEYDEARPRCPLRITRHSTVPDPYGDYDMTTYSPCCRPEGHEGECRNSRLILGWPGFVTVSALVAEVERLREQRIASTAALLKGYETGKAEERELTVAWLRYEAEMATGTNTTAAFQHAAWLDTLADDIERGEHRRTGEEG